MIDKLTALVQRWTQQTADAADASDIAEIRAGMVRATCAQELLALLDSLPAPAFIDVVFDGPPGPESGRFVEVEDMTGKSVGGVGEWIDRGDGMWALRIARPL